MTTVTYKSIVKDITTQVLTLTPKYLSPKNKKYLAKNIKFHSLIAARIIFNDKGSNLSTEQKTLVCKCFAKGIFQKCLNLFGSGIELKYWDSIIHQITQEIVNCLIVQSALGCSLEQILQEVENYINKSYKESIDAIENKNVKMYEYKNGHEFVKPVYKELEEENFPPAAFNFYAYQYKGTKWVCLILSLILLYVSYWIILNNAYFLRSAIAILFITPIAIISLIWYLIHYKDEHITTEDAPTFILNLQEQTIIIPNALVTEKQIAAKDVSPIDIIPQAKVIIHFNAIKSVQYIRAGNCLINIPTMYVEICLYNNLTVFLKMNGKMRELLQYYFPDKWDSEYIKL